MPNSKLLKILLRLSLVFVSIIMAIAVTEQLLRAFKYQKEITPSLYKVLKNEPLYQSDPVRVYSMKRNVDTGDRLWESNQYGFRKDPRLDGLSELESKHLLFTVGDSFTYGHGVDHSESYPSVLNSMISGNGLNYKVMNAGVPGYGLDQEYLTIQDIATNYSPEVILWNITPNDVTGTNGDCLFRKLGDRYIRVPAYLNLYFYKGLLTETLSYNTLKNSNVVDLLYKYIDRQGDHGHVTFGCTISGNREVVRKAVIERFEYLLAQTKNLAKDRGFKLILVIAPYQYDFDPNQNTNDEFYKDYLALDTLLKGRDLQYINSNTEIKLWQKEIETSFLAQNLETGLTEDAKVLGATVEESKDIFLEEDAFPYGLRHLNGSGNYLFAKVVFEGIKETLKN